jgi:hypothetical protein
MGFDEKTDFGSSNTRGVGGWIHGFTHSHDK